ncbi:galactose oxidase-like domain-containing protein, partial [Algibacter sp. PT7-4]|uniref:galactose oxidase-like domain-containing protein n=1 Tax=Algibacter ulvanivorans TaxID=3400999 RepID=UPI003AAFE807
MKKIYLYFLPLVLCTFNLRAQNPSEIGKWSDPIIFDIVPVAAANLPNGKLIVWSSKYKDTYGGADGSTYTQIFDPFQGIDGVAEQSTESNTNHDMFCPGINNLPDGKILAAGGSSSEKTSLYDYETGLWSVADNMNVPRGYQGNVTLSDGSVFTIGGSWAGELGGKYAEVWTPNTGWIGIPSLQGEMLTDGNNPNLDDPDPSQQIYRTDNHAWLIPAPNGKIFHAGPGTNMHWIDINDINNPQVQDLGSRLDDVYSMNGNAAMFDIGKVLKTGGSRTYSMGAPASDLSYVIDINSETPIVTKVPGLNEARAMHNTTVLPDGTVLITGGLDTGSVFTDEGASYAGELFDPVTNTWSDTAVMQEARTYHSVAILMQDARVFVGGGGLCAGPVPDCVNHFSAEIYSPAYLFNNDGSLATRPTISAPETASYNTNIQVSGSANITEFSLVRFSSATHSTNNEQRRIPVDFSFNGGDYTVVIPDRELLPPGIYMLFGIDNNGVPSIAESIKIGSVIPLENNPTLVLDLKFEEGTGGTVKDFSIYNNDATIVERDNNSNPVNLTQNYWSNNGFNGNSLEMDGSEHNSNSLVEIPYSSSLGSVSKEITVMAWVYRDEIEFNGSIFANDYPDLFFGFHNSLYKWAFPTTDGRHVRLFSGYTPPETWLHMAATYDGNIARLYANGVEINSGYISGEITLETVEQYFSSFTTSGFYDRRIIGNESGITDEVDGKIDELKVFNKAHRPEVIQYYYKLGLEQNSGLYDCTAENIITQYKIGDDGDWLNGDYVEAAEGVEVYIRAIVPGNKEYMVTLPVVDGPTLSSVSDFPNFEDTTAYKIDSYSGDGLVEVENNGIYAFTSIDGCAKTIRFKAIVEQTCDDHVQEYKINGEWQSGEEVINVNQGDEVIISALPNIDGLTITLPDGTRVGDDFDLGNVDYSDAGFYTLTSIYGCEVTLQIIVNGMPPLPCEGNANFLPEYIINGVSGSGEGEITVIEGSELLLSINQEGVGFAITLPDSTVINGDYNLGNVTQSQSGLYTFESESGCVKTLDVNIVDDSICAIHPLTQEYKINGEWQSGEEVINVNQGDEVILSALPNEVDVTIT